MKVRLQAVDHVEQARSDGVLVAAAVTHHVGCAVEIFGGEPTPFGARRELDAIGDVEALQNEERPPLVIERGRLTRGWGVPSP